VEERSPADEAEAADCGAVRRRLADVRAGLRLAAGNGGRMPTVGQLRAEEARTAEAAAECADLDGAETLAEVLGDREEERLRYFRVFLSYVSQGARAGDIGAMLRNILALCSAVAPELLGGMPGTEVAVLTGESKQAAHARKERLTRRFAERQGVAGARFYGKNASSEARENMAAAQRGNKNRSSAARREQGLPVPESRPQKAPRRGSAAVMRFRLRDEANFLLVALVSGERRPVRTHEEALRVWREDGLSVAGGSAVVMLVPEGGGRPLAVAQITRAGRMVDNMGREIA
jgi:hypothetical protein